MLVLTRKVQEKIRIGNDITITVVRIKGNSVRIGIEAPESVRVMRPESESKPRSHAQPAATGESGTTEMTFEVELNSTPGADDGSSSARGDNDSPADAPHTCPVGQQSAGGRCASYSGMSTAVRNRSRKNRNSQESAYLPGRSVVGSMRRSASVR